MFHYVTIDGKNQLKELLEDSLQVVTTSNTLEVTEAESAQIKAEGLQAFLYDTALRLKPLVTFALDKPQIQSGGTDTAMLTVTVSGEPVTALDVFFNGVVHNEPLINNQANMPLTGTDKQTIIISADPEKYRFTSVTLEVV